jgi:hypothetical protein
LFLTKLVDKELFQLVKQDKNFETDEIFYYYFFCQFHFLNLETLSVE